MYCKNTTDDFTVGPTATNTLKFIGFQDKNNQNTSYLSESTYNGGRVLTLATGNKASGSVRGPSIVMSIGNLSTDVPLIALNGRIQFSSITSGDAKQGQIFKSSDTNNDIATLRVMGTYGTNSFAELRLALNKANGTAGLYLVKSINGTVTQTSVASL